MFLNRPLRSAALALTIAAPAFAQAPARHTITHEDLYLMKRVGAPSLSPDGRWIVFPVSEPSYVEADQASDLWIVPSDGSAEPRRLTNTKGGEGGVTWSADGRRIAFTARREGDEVAQVYVLGVSDAGEAQRVTSLSTGAATPRWRPDGRAILFTSMIYPGAVTDSANRAAAAERRGRKWNARVYESSPIRIWDHWLDDRRASLFIQPLDGSAPARDLLAGSHLAAGAGFRGQLGSGGEDMAAAWTPDGSGVVFAATTNLNDWTSAEVLQSLWLVPASGGEPRRLTMARGDFGSPRFGPDGHTLFATMTPSTNQAFNNQRLVSFAWPMSGTPEPMPVAGGADFSVGGWEFAGDGRSIVFLAENQGHTKLYRVPAAGGAVREVGTMTSGTYGGLQSAGATIAATWESAINPAEVGRIDGASGRWTALTHFDTERAAECCDSNCYADGRTIPVCNYNVLYRDTEAKFVEAPRDWGARDGGQRGFGERSRSLPVVR